MSANIGNGNVTFGDGTSLSSANLPYANVTNPSTKLSQFTNDLGNYENWVTSVNTSGVGGASNPHVNFTWNGSQIGLQVSNCNCNCYCNC
jgi:hypothetical protein